MQPRSPVRRSFASARGLHQAITWLGGCSTVIATACGGGGGSAGALLAKPQVTLALEGPAITDSGFTTLHGSAISSRGIASVEAETPFGPIAAASADGFATFGVRVPVLRGEHAVTLIARDPFGRATTVESPPLRFETPMLRGVRGVAVDPTGKLGVAVVSVPPGELLRVDKASGERQVLSGPTVGSGPALGDLFDAAFTADGSRILGGYRLEARLVVVDARTGDRTQIDTVSAMRGVAHDAKRDHAVYTSTFSQVRAIDLASGDDLVITDTGDGRSPSIDAPEALAYDDLADRYLVLDAASRTLIEVSPDDGARKILSRLADATQGPTGSTSAGLAVDPSQRVAFVLSDRNDDLIQVDLDSGARKVALSGDASSGPTALRSATFSRDPGDGQIWAAGKNSVIEFDLAAGKRAAVGSARLGGGDRPDAVSEFGFIVPDLARHRLLFRDASEDCTVLDLNTGDRNALRDGAGVDQQFADLAIAADGRSFFAIRQVESTLERIDAVTLESAVISSANRGSGPALVFPGRLAIDEAGGRAFVIDRAPVLDRLMTIDLASGDREVLAQRGDGLSIDLLFLFGVEWDAVTGRVLVIDSAQPGVVQIDPTTRSRTLFADQHDESMPDVPAGLFRLDPAEHSLLVVSRPDFPATPTVIRVDLDDANRSEVITATIGAGPVLHEIGGLGIDSASGRLFVSEISLDAFVQVDRASGDRLVIAK